MWNIESLTFESEFGFKLSEQRNFVQRVLAIDHPQTDEMVRLLEEAPLVLEAGEQDPNYGKRCRSCSIRRIGNFEESKFQSFKWKVSGGLMDEAQREHWIKSENATRCHLQILEAQ